MDTNKVIYRIVRGVANFAAFPLKWRAGTREQAAETTQVRHGSFGCFR